MFNVFGKTKGAITLFTAPNSPVSQSLANFIKSKYPHNSNNFKVDITENIPTPEQWRIITHSNSIPETIRKEIAELAGSPSEKSSTTAAGKVTEVFQEIKDKLKNNKFPILVDWDSGKVAVNDESLAKQILEEKKQNN